MESSLYIAVDLGAGSGRVFLAGVGPGELLLEEIHRFQYPPSREDGHLRWNFPHIFGEIKTGLRQAGVRAQQLGRNIVSIGIDSWGVDYGLIDAEGNLTANPICYRDDRTTGVMPVVFGKVSRSKIFEKTGIQFQNFNTLYQLYSQRDDLKGATSALLLPDLINFFLTGKRSAEYTNATTTQMVNAATGDWDLDLLERLVLPASLFPNIVPAGAEIGPLKPAIARELGLQDVKVIAPATHDTGSAVAGAPISENWSYISSGTWSLIGIELDRSLINQEVAQDNFTNEGGAFGTVRFLKNVMGLWIFESCRREWMANGVNVEYDDIIRDVADRKGFQTLVFPDDERFLSPPSMLGAIEQQMRETGQEFDGRPATVAKTIFDSLALRYASVLRSIESLTGRILSGVQILGGGGRNRYLNQLTADASGLTAKAGLTEATVVGNVLVQAISVGRFGSLTEARRHIDDNFTFDVFIPNRSADLAEAASRYATVEARFVG